MVFKNKVFNRKWSLFACLIMLGAGIGYAEVDNQETQTIGATQGTILTTPATPTASTPSGPFVSPIQVPSDADLAAKAKADAAAKTLADKAAAPMLTLSKKRRPMWIRQKHKSIQQQKH